MNSPLREPQVNVPATTPTVGAAIGGVLGAILVPAAASVGIPPVVVAPILATFGAWLAHILHSKLGTPE